jgi:hypothetical protein
LGFELARGSGGIWGGRCWRGAGVFEALVAEELAVGAGEGTLGGGDRSREILVGRQSLGGFFAAAGEEVLEVDGGFDEVVDEEAAEGVARGELGAERFGENEVLAEVRGALRLSDLGFRLAHRCGSSG